MVLGKDGPEDMGGRRVLFWPHNLKCLLDIQVEHPQAVGHTILEVSREVRVGDIHLEVSGLWRGELVPCF